jgi:hypothetical protein
MRKIGNLLCSNLYYDGIITLWYPMVMEVEFSVSFDNVLMVGGRMKQED